MIKHLKITPPVIGRISIGRVIEKNGKRLPEKDDQFTITTQVQTPSGWLLHPLDQQLRQETQQEKLRSLPITLLFNDPELNFRAEYTAFDRKTGRVTCLCDGETSQQFTPTGRQELPCNNRSNCPDDCKPYGRLVVKLTDSSDMEAFMFRTTGYNSIRTLMARLHYYYALTDGNLSTLPLSLKIRGKSTTQSFGTPIYYVDLVIREGMSLEDAIQYAKAEAQRRKEAGINQAALDEAARLGYQAAPFEFDEEEIPQIVEEFYPETEPEQPVTQAAYPQSAGNGLMQRLQR